MAHVKEEPRGSWGPAQEPQGPCGSWGPVQEEHTHSEGVEPGPRLKEEPQEFPFHMVTVKSEDDEDKSSVLHQRPTEEKREETNVWECGAEAGCSSDPLTQFHSDSEEHTDSSEDTDHSQDYSQEQAPAKRRSYAMVPPDSAHLRDARPHCCPECGKSFSQKSNLEEHMLSHTGEKPHECLECGKRFQSRQCLKGHMLLHSGENPFSCSECGRSFTTKGKLNKHVLVHSEERRYNCPECGNKFRRKSHLEDHMLSHTGEKQHKCPECDKTFKRKSYVKLHMLIHTGERPHKCPICGKSLTQKSGLRKHLRTQHLMCPVCEVSFPDERSLKEHLNAHEEEEPKDPSVLKPHRCPECGKRFRRKSHLKDHKLSHSGERPHQCPECGMKFKRKPDLNQHMLKHTGERPHKCSVCVKRFKLKYCLINHEQIFHNVCRVCEKGFKDEGARTLHMKTHKVSPDSDSKRFKCLECGRRFSTVSKLQTHIRAHSQKRHVEAPVEGATLKGTSVLSVALGDNTPHTKPSDVQFVTKDLYLNGKLTNI